MEAENTIQTLVVMVFMVNHKKEINPGVKMGSKMEKNTKRKRQCETFDLCGLTHRVCIYTQRHKLF